jgi:4a-hydroxytetrahydrobiopterin dehydratase
MPKTANDKLDPAQIKQQLQSLPEWSHNATKMQIEKKFARKNFLDAAAFINQIAGAAEQHDHHPDILLSDYKNVTVIFSTHSAGGITQNDFDMAAAVEKLAQ